MYQKNKKYAFRKAFLEKGVPKNITDFTAEDIKRRERRFIHSLNPNTPGHKFEKTIKVQGKRNWILNFRGVLIECDAYCDIEKIITEIKMKNMLEAKKVAGTILALAHLSKKYIKQVICITQDEQCIVENFSKKNLEHAAHLLYKAELCNRMDTYNSFKYYLKIKKENIEIERDLLTERIEKIDYILNSLEETKNTKYKKAEKINSFELNRKV